METYQSPNAKACHNEKQDANRKEWPGLCHLLSNVQSLVCPIVLDSEMYHPRMWYNGHKHIALISRTVCTPEDGEADMGICNILLHLLY